MPASRLIPPSPAVPVDHLDQLVVRGLGGVAVARADGLGGAVFEVVAHQLAADRAQGLLDGGDLGQDVGAVAVLLDHLLEAAHLPLDPPQALLVAVIDPGIDGYRLLVPRAAAAAGDFHGLIDVRFHTILLKRSAPAAGAGCWPPR